jgi:hypothetical protein
MEDEIVSFNSEKCLEELRCPICLQIFNEPIMELPNQHIFCENCLNKSNKGNMNGTCPICKNAISSLIKPRFIISLLNNIEMKCLSSFNEEKCDWKGNAIDYYVHLKNCNILKKKNCDILKDACNKIREILSKEITPHLKEAHLTIFNDYVKDWDWLETDNRDWKWWWWCKNPWWNNQRCTPCNELRHKYLEEVQIYENRRIEILNNMQ